MEGTATTPWTYTGNLLNQGKASVDDSEDGYLPLSMSADSCHTSSLLQLEAFYKQRPTLNHLYDLL